MATFSAAEVIDKTLIAKRNVKVFLKYPNSNEFYNVSANQEVGRVSSYIYPNDKSTIWWQLYPKKKNSPDAYVMHNPGDFDVESLIDQGAQTEDQKNKGKDFEYYVKKYAAPLVVFTGVIAVFREFIKSNK